MNIYFFRGRGNRQTFSKKYFWRPHPIQGFLKYTHELERKLIELYKIQWLYARYVILLLCFWLKSFSKTGFKFSKGSSKSKAIQQLVESSPKSFLLLLKVEKEVQYVQKEGGTAKKILRKKEERSKKKKKKPKPKLFFFAFLSSHFERKAFNIIHSANKTQYNHRLLEAAAQLLKL